MVALQGARKKNAASEEKKLTGRAEDVKQCRSGQLLMCDTPKKIAKFEYF